MFRIPPRRLRDLVKSSDTKRSVYRFFSELASSIRRIEVFESMLATLIVTMLALAVGRFFLLPWYYALPAPALYLLVRLIRIHRIDVLTRTERAFPEFREQLITIKDNFEKTHEMEEALEQDVLMRSHKVESAGFFDPRSFSMRIIIVLLLFFVTGFFTQFTYEDVPPFWEAFFPQDDPESGVDPNFNFWQRSSITGTGESEDIDSTDKIFGDDDPLLQGIEPVPIELEAARDALDLSTSTDASPDSFERYSPTRLDVSGAEYFEETIPVSKHEIVQNYFRDR